MTWANPAVHNVRRFIKHSAYNGTYLYGRQHRQRVQRGGEPVSETRLIGQFVELPDHHEGYITPEEFLENQRILALNAKAPNQSQIGPGPALLGGRVACARHGAMSVHYQNRVRDVGWSFTCLGDYLSGGSQCVCAPGVLLEELVVDAALGALDVPVVDEVHRLWRASQRDWSQQHRGLQVEIDRKQESLGRLRQRLLEQEAGAYPRLRAMLEEEYEKTAAEVDQLRVRLAREDAEPDPFTEKRWETLKLLCADVRSIWQAPTTTDQDRKQLIRILIEKVVIEKVEAERVQFRIVWADGRPSKAIELLRSPYFHGLMLGWHIEGLSPQVMVERLAAMGARTQQGNPWSLDTVRTTVAIAVKRVRLSGKGGHLPVRVEPHTLMGELEAAGLGPEEIAVQLNARGTLTRFRKLWSASSVRRVLSQKRKQNDR